MITQGFAPETVLKGFVITDCQLSRAAAHGEDAVLAELHAWCGLINVAEQIKYGPGPRCPRPHATHVSPLTAVLAPGVYR